MKPPVVAPVEPVPFSFLVRRLGLRQALRCESATWVDGQLVLAFGDRALVLTPYSREELVRRLGAQIGEARRGWLTSDGELWLEHPDGSTEAQVPDPAAVDAAAQTLLEWRPEEDASRRAA